eukprot:821328-Prorocentrum_lima.AAC.1
MWIRAERTYPYQLELLLGEDDQPNQDFVDIGEETPLTALKISIKQEEQKLWVVSKMLKTQ